MVEAVAVRKVGGVDALRVLAAARTDFGRRAVRDQPEAADHVAKRSEILVHAANAAMAVLLVAGITVSSPASAGSRCYACSHRSAEAKSAFRREHPCPATGRIKGPCPGYVIDHVTPLCACGADAPQNMQWQTVEDGKAKDRLERRLCR